MMLLYVFLVMLSSAAASSAAIVLEAEDVEEGIPSVLRPVRAADDLSVQVSVRPKVVEFGPNQIISVHCRAKGGTKHNDVPAVRFYRKLGDETYMPLSSGDPGVLVRSMSSSFGTHIQRTIKTLYLGNKSWLTMHFGDNVFYCRASNTHGRSALAYFIVQKIMYPPAVPPSWPARQPGMVLGVPGIPGVLEAGENVADVPNVSSALMAVAALKGDVMRPRVPLRSGSVVDGGPKKEIEDLR